MGLEVGIIATGDEIIRGLSTDGNSPWMAAELRMMGFSPTLLAAVGDREDDIRFILRRAVERLDLVAMSGGLGATFDDLTRDAVSSEFGCPLELHSPSMDSIRERFRERGRPLPAGIERQAMIPRGAEVLPNRVGTAPGFWLRLGSKHLFALPGVPHEMKAMFSGEVVPRLGEMCPSLVPEERRVWRLFGLPESEVDRRLREHLSPAELEHLALQASDGVISVRWAAPAGAPAPAVAELMQGPLFQEYLFGEGDDTLAVALCRELKSRGERVAVAESCTGGGVAWAITQVPGSSDVFTGGWVAYSNEAKEFCLGVPADTIRGFGAVSEPVAKRLAVGACEASGASLGIGVTGIAGPGGGTPDKPVGLVYIATCYHGSVVVRRHRFLGDRDTVRRFAIGNALYLGRRAVTAGRRPA